MTGPRTGARRRRRGSTYILVLSISTIVATIGLTSMALVQVEMNRTAVGHDAIEARFLALTAIDLGLMELEKSGNAAQWRSDLAAKTLVTNRPFAGGTVSLEGSDPIDASLTNNTTDPVVLKGIGRKGRARHMVTVTVTFSGSKPSFTSGTWAQAVD